MVRGLSTAETSISGRGRRTNVTWDVKRRANFGGIGRVLSEPFRKLWIASLKHVPVYSPAARVPVVAVDVRGHVELCADAPRTLVGVSLPVEVSCCYP